MAQSEIPTHLSTGSIQKIVSKDGMTKEDMVLQILDFVKVDSKGNNSAVAAK
jgi:hypothetical protein